MLGLCNPIYYGHFQPPCHILVVPLVWEDIQMVNICESQRLTFQVSKLRWRCLRLEEVLVDIPFSFKKSHRALPIVFSIEPRMVSML
jgi:hypothetical protein